MLLTENVVTLAKTEGTYGVDAVPAAVDAVVTSQAKLTPFEATYLPRQLDKPNSGADQELVTAVHAMLEFSVECVGSGTLGTAPAFGKLIKACRWSEDIVAVTSVAYRPDRSILDSLSMRFFMDGQMHPFLGARGTFTLGANSGEIPRLNFKFTGLWVPPSSSAAPSPLTGWDAFQIPDVVDFDNTPTPELHGYTGVFRSFNFDAGSEVVYRNRPGAEYVRIVRHGCTGSISLDAPALSDKNYFTAVKANTLGTFKLQHGQVAARQWFLESMNDQCQVLRPRYGDDGGIATLDGDLKFIPDAGADEVELRFAAA